MKRVILGVLVGLPLAAIGGGALFAYNMDQKLGFRESAPISHRSLEDEGTRLRAVIEPGKLQAFVLNHLPPELAERLPSWLPMSADELIANVLPHEVALLSGSSFREGKLNFTVFVNERRGGRVLEDQINAMRLPPALSIIEYEAPLATLRERGMLVAQARLPIPEGFEERLLEQYRHEPEGAPLAIQGGHLIEILFDNRNGEAMTLAICIADAIGEDWETALDTFPKTIPGRIALETLPEINYARIWGDLIDDNTMGIRLEVNATENAQVALGMGSSLGLPELKKLIKKQGMALEGSAKWDDDASGLIGDFTLTGFEPIIAQQVAALI